VAVLGVELAKTPPALDAPIASKKEKGMSERFVLEADPHGAGGFAKVLRGHDVLLDRDVAVKVLDPLATEFPDEDQERFRREARILATLSHPNIPAIYDVDLSPGKFEIYFQFIDGMTLREVIEKEGRCALEDARRWLRQIALALDHAHSLGIVHRDVNPANIIITPDRQSAYLVDFGIALSKEDAHKITKSGFVIGTPGYMSPEHLAGLALDYSTDVYCLAVTLYEALAGQPVPHGAYQALSTANEAIPPEIDQLIEDCLLLRDQRLDTAKSFNQRLAGALRTTRPMSEILAKGRLHELAAALALLTAADFVQLPAGQRALVLTKVSDIVASGEPQLGLPAEQFLILLLSRALLLESDAYRQVVGPAVQWAFEIPLRGYIGSLGIRRELRHPDIELSRAVQNLWCIEFLDRRFKGAHQRNDEHRVVIPCTILRRPRGAFCHDL